MCIRDRMDFDTNGAHQRTWVSRACDLAALTIRGAISAGEVLPEGWSAIVASCMQPKQPLPATPAEMKRVEVETALRLPYQAAPIIVKRHDPLCEEITSGTKATSDGSTTTVIELVCVCFYLTHQGRSAP